MKVQSHTPKRARRIALLSICMLLFFTGTLYALPTVSRQTGEGSVEPTQSNGASSQALSIVDLRLSSLQTAESPQASALYQLGKHNIAGILLSIGSESGDDLSDGSSGSSDADAPATDVEDESSDSEVTVSTDDTQTEAAPETPQAVRTHSITHTYEPKESVTYIVTVQYGDDAGIPDGTELEVKLLDNDDAELAKQRKKALNKHLKLKDGARVLSNKYLSVKLISNGSEIQPQAPVTLGIQTNTIAPAASDSVEIVPINSSKAKASDLRNLTGKRDDGSEDQKPEQTSVSCTVNELGELGLAVVAEPKFTWHVNDVKVQLWGSRNAKVEADDTPVGGEWMDDKELMNFFAVRCEPQHAWVPRLWLTSGLEADAEPDEFAGLLCYQLNDDGSLGDAVFGKAGNIVPAAIAADGTYALLWDTGYRDMSIDKGEVHLEGLVPDQTNAEADDVTDDYSDTSALVGEEDANKFELQTVAAYDVSFDVDGEAWTPGSEHAVLATIASDAVSEGQDVEVWRVSGDGEAAPVEDAQVQDGGVSFSVEEAGTYVVVERVSLEREFVASDDQTYRITVSYDGSAGLPRNAELAVSEVEQGSAEYDDYVAQSAEQLGTTTDAVAYAKAFDITLIDPETGEHYQPTGDVSVSIELLNTEIQDDTQLDVVHIADEEVQTMDSTVEGDTVSFQTDGFSVFVVMRTVLKQTLTASDDQTYEVTVTYDSTSGIPTDAELSVREIKQGDDGYDEYVSKSADALGKKPKDLAFARPFDITLRNPQTGEEYQPTKDVQVSIKLLDDSLEEYQHVDVVHVHGDDDTQVDALDSSVSDETVEFQTSGFSVYVLTALTHLGTYYFYSYNSFGDYQGYNFYDDQGNLVISQTIKNRETLVAPHDSPVNPNDPNAEFKGWYMGTGDSGNPFPDGLGEPFDFDEPQSINDNETFYLYAVFSKYAHVTFHSQYDNNSQTYPVLKIMPVELTAQTVSVDISDITAAYYSTSESDHYEFYGWSTTPGQGTTEIITNLENYAVSGDIDLYPVFQKVNYLTLVSGYTGTSATYISPVAVPAGGKLMQSKVKSACIPERPGYTFQGWYLGVENAGTVNQNGMGTQVSEADGTLCAVNETAIQTTTGVDGYLLLSSDVTLYAKWEATDVNYSIVVWKQRKTDDADLSNEKKTWDFEESFVLQAKPYTSVSVDEKYKHLEIDDNYNSVHDSGHQIGAGDTNPYSDYSFSYATPDTAQEVAFKGTTVFNLYYGYNGSQESQGTTEQTITRVYGSETFEAIQAMPGTQLSSLALGAPSETKTGYTFAWYLDSTCTKAIDDTTTMPNHDLTIYGKWSIKRIAIHLNTNYGALFGVDGTSGTGATYFNVDYGESIEEYSHVTREYVPSESGSYYFVNHDWNGSYNDRKTYYTQDISKATELNTFKYEPGTYFAEGWFVQEPDGSETLFDFKKQSTYNFAEHLSDDIFTLKLHWKLAGIYYLQYNTDVTVDGEELIGTLNDDDDAALPNPSGYRDQADITISGRAVAPEGYTFVGWTVRGDDSGAVYYPGNTFSLPGEYAVMVNGKKTVYLDAVYQRIMTAKIVYDANGGTISDKADSGYPCQVGTGGSPVLGEDSNPVNLATHKVVRDTANGTVTVSGLANNSPVKLSSGGGFTAPEDSGATLTGWNTEPDGSGDHYGLGSYQDESGRPIYVDINDPVTLYAEWQIKVYFDKNDADAAFSESGWTNYTLINDSDNVHNGQYYTVAYIHATLAEPAGTVTKTGENFDFWSKTSVGDQTNAFQFGTEALTGELTLYAQFTEAVKVPYHVVSTNKVNKDSWRKTDTLRVTTGGLDLSSANDINSYVTAEMGYTYSYACLSDSTDSINEENKITAVKVDGDVVRATTDGSTYAEIPNGKQIYLVYHTANADNRVKLAYVQEGSSGALSNVVGATEGTITYNGELFSSLNTTLLPPVLSSWTVANGSIEGEGVTGQVLTLSGTPLEASQSIYAGVFNVPPVLDDGTEPLALVYTNFGVSNSNEPVTNTSGLVGSGNKLYLRYDDGKRQWSQDKTKWTTFTGDTLYVVYRPRGFELEITKAVAGDNTGISSDESFAVTVTSDAITMSSYPVEGTGYKTVTATPASDVQPGSIELTVKDGSDIKISGLGSGGYTVTETHNANYVLSAKIGNDPADVTDGKSVTVALKADKKVALQNAPFVICRIHDIGAGGYKEFYTLNKALEYAGTNMDGEAEIQMLRDYVMPSWDVLVIPSGYDITLTSSDAEAKKITRNSELATTSSMLTNYGTLTLSNIILDGTDVQAKSSMVQNAGTLTVGNGATFQNAYKVTGSGGAIYQSQGTLTVRSGASYIGNNVSENGGAIYAHSGIVEINGGTFTGNTAASGNGGVLYYAGNDTVTITGGSFGDGTAENANSAVNGGAIYASGGNLTVTGSDTIISGNNAESGGAIYSDSGTVNISGGTIGGNTAAQNGGAVYSGSGEVSVSGGTISGNTATNGNGGAICSEASTVTITDGTITGSQAEAGFGGALYVGSGTVEMSGGTVGGTGEGAANSAKNGAGIYVDTGSATLSAGSITSNVVKRRDGDSLSGSTMGGAVGVGSNSARLYLSGDVQITGNKGEVNAKDDDGHLTSSVIMADCNVYLDQDTDDVINIAGLIDANIGIYASDTVYSKRGVPGAKFATYTTDANKNCIKSDRDPSFSVVSESATKKLYWGNEITVVVRYQKTSFSTQLPPEWTKTGNDYKSVTISNYYPVMGDDGYVAISALAENLYTTRTAELSSLGLSTSAAYGGAWLSDSSSFVDYVTKLTWDTETKKWELTNHNGVATEELGNKQLIVYYTEPAYISIENNTDMALTISSLSLTVNGTPMSVINTPDVAGYGLLFAKDGAIRTGLFPVESSDLVLGANKSVSLLIPGGRDMNYSLGGSFSTTTGGTVSLRTTKITGSGYDSAELSVGSDGAFAFPTGKKTLNKAGTYQIIFGDDRMICKINTQEISNVISADYLTCTAPDAGGNVEYVFKSLRQAIAFVKKYMSATKTATIEMLTDYLLPASDNLAIEASYNITMTTASSVNGTYRYTPAVPGENRATISRDSENKDPLIAVTSGNNNTFLTIENLIIDGKSVQGSTKDGAVSVKNAGLTVRESAFKNVYAGNGGAIFAECDQNQTNSWIKVYNSTFSNCHSTKTGPRDGGGAIHAYVNYMEVDDCTFDSCDADWQAGGIFHKVENNNKYTESYVKNCTFTNCRSKAAGGMELGSRNIIVLDCTFTNCVATARNGGGFNVYALKNGEPTADCWTTVIDCTFTDCHNTGTDGGRGGGFRCTSKYTTIVNTDFTNTSATIGGAVALSNKNAELAEIYGGTIDGGVATNQGGAVYSLAKSMKIGGSYTYKTDENGKPIIYKNGVRVDGKTDTTTETTINSNTTIKNCTAKNAGGGIYHENNTDKYEIAVTNTTLQNCVSTNGAGGGICTNSRTVTVTGSKIQNNRAKGNGGGICSNYDSASYRLTVDSTVISGNVSGGMGGGIYNKSQLTLRNGTRITGNRLTGNTAVNAAGVYVPNSRTLTVGTADATATDVTTVKDNTTAGGTASDVRLAPNGSNNATNSVSVLCDLSGEIRVVNPGAAGTQFGTRANESIKGFTEGQHVFVADSGSLYGVYNRNDLTKLIWRGGVICKLTDSSGHLLYLDEDGTDPAVFDRLDDRTDGSRLSPFSYLRQDSPVLYRKGESTPLDLIEDEVQVRMLVSSFESNTYLVTSPTNKDYSNRKMLTITTASVMDSDGYPYTGRAGSYGKIIRGYTSSDGSPFIKTGVNLTLKNIVVDGGAEDKTSPKVYKTSGGLVCASGKYKLDGKDTDIANVITITLGNNAVLQNAKVVKDDKGNTKNGGAIYLYKASLFISGGAIYNCTNDDGNGGAVFKTGSPGKLEFSSGIISHCSAKNGGGVYFDNGSEGFSMSGSAQITSCEAVEIGGGVYLKAGKTMNMTGGSISGNHAGTSGGGIYLKYNSDNSGTRLNLSGRVTVSGNTCGSPAYDCNVQLGEANEPAFTENSNNWKLWDGVINSLGISRNSHIGIYVPGEDNHPDDKMAGTETHYEVHGKVSSAFGTFSSGSDTKYLYCFVNDRNGLKGGLQVGDTTYIHWVEIFSLKVGKTVISGETDDLDEEFTFKVTFSETEGGVGIFGLNTEFTYDDGRTDSDTGVPVTIPITNGTAEFTLKTGETVIVNDLPAETTNNAPVYYRVEEVFSDPNRAAHYTTTTSRSTNPSEPKTLYVKGRIGENLNREDVTSKYISNAFFDNLNAICKLTSSKNGGVLLRTLDATSGNFVPAVYTSLHNSNNSGAFDVINASTPLYFWNSFTMKYEQYDYSGNDTLNVEMLIGDHTPSQPVTLDQNMAVTLTTADRNAKDGYPYVGNEAIASINRGKALGGENYVFTANGALTLKNICLDGNNLSVSKGLVTVNSKGSLTVQTGATLQNSKATTNGGAVYVNGGTIAMTGGTIKDNTATSNGGAVFVNNGTMTMSGGTIKDNKTTKYGGGAIRMEGNNARVTISGGEITDNEVQNNDANGGAISVRGGALTVSGGTISNNKVTWVTGSSQTPKAVGGAIYVHNSATATISGGTISQNTVTATDVSKPSHGGAVYVEGKLTLSGGTFNGNTAATNGAGIYLTTAANLYLSGKPTFGVGTEANTVTKDNYSSLQNGGESVYANNKVRQDIYLVEANQNSPSSIVVNGDLTGTDGSIWVWAESDFHHKQNMPFAKLADGVVFAEKPEGAQYDSAHLMVFRNAQPDSVTENGTNTYLYGTIEGDTEGFVYWSGVKGSRKVILRKVGSSNYESLEGAKFTIYASATSADPVHDSNDNVLEDLESNANGTFYVGELPYGTYYVKETNAPTNPSGYSAPTLGHFFIITVNENGVGYQYTEGDQTLLSNEVSATTP